MVMPPCLRHARLDLCARRTGPSTDEFLLAASRTRRWDKTCTDLSSPSTTSSSSWEKIRPYNGIWCCKVPEVMTFIKGSSRPMPGGAHSMIVTASRSMGEDRPYSAALPLEATGDHDPHQATRSYNAGARR